MSDHCDLCQSGQLRCVYWPDTTERGLSVYLCQRCGLVQSLPRIDHVAKRLVSTSSGAAWGNVRYGKAFRTASAIGAISRVLPLSRVACCLDVGSNRGSFVLRLRELNPTSEVWAIEPDTIVVDRYAGRDDIRCLSTRLEAT